ncbi:MAG: metallophosphoesterase [Nitrososphaerota archaeon]|nr:metallophosphoesterase [Nitrososphaerota archaeon]
MVESGQPIMIISDIHYEQTYHHGVWEGEAHDWLLRTVRSARPASLITLGDLGHAWRPVDWKSLTDLVPVHAIYGNHDNLDVLHSARNKDGTRVLAEDGEVRTIGGLKVGFINGIMAKKGRLKVKDGVPRQSAEDFLSAATKLVGVDILATHASPNLPEYGGRYHASEEFEILDEVLKRVDPPLSTSGHLSGPYTLSKLRDTTILRIDSGPAERHYALLDCRTKQIRIMRDYELVVTGGFRGR